MIVISQSVTHIDMCPFRPSSYIVTQMFCGLFCVFYKRVQNIVRSTGAKVEEKDLGVLMKDDCKMSKAAEKANKILGCRIPES